MQSSDQGKIDGLPRVGTCPTAKYMGSYMKFCCFRIRFAAFCALIPVLDQNHSLQPRFPEKNLAFGVSAPLSQEKSCDRKHLVEDDIDNVGKFEYYISGMAIVNTLLVFSMPHFYKVRALWSAQHTVYLEYHGGWSTGAEYILSSGIVASCRLRSTNDSDGVVGITS